MSWEELFPKPALPGRLEGVVTLSILYKFFFSLLGQLFFEDILFLDSLYQPIMLFHS